MGKYVIEFYSSGNGVKPARDFLDILDSKMLAKIFKITDLLEKFGSNVRMPYSEYLEKKTQKTPRKEIDRAKKYRDDYMRRCVK